MDIKLIQPRMTLRIVDSEFKRAMAPSLALLTLAALTPSIHETEIADENVEKLRLDDKPDLVGITVNVDTFRRGCEIAAEYRRRGVPVIAGGIHASANPDEALEHFDAVCIGEAEGVWGDILDDCQRGTLRRVYRSISDGPLAMPLPDRRRIVQSRYLYTNIVSTSRGCPFACDFCYNSSGYVTHRTRCRPIDDVVAEIEALGTRHVMFIDDNFIGNPAWTKALLERIQPMGLVWNAAVSANIVHHPELLDLMARSGCRSLFIGFESVNPRALAGVGKTQNQTALYDKLVGEIHRRGIMINASLVFGFDEDTPEVFPATLDWLVRNKIETMTAHILTPYPGTVLYRRLLEQGRIIDFDYTHYNTSHVVFRPQNMTPEQLLSGYLWMYRRMYSISNILKRLPDTPSQRAPYLLFSFLYRKFGRATSFLARFGLMNRLGRLARRLAYDV